MVSHASSRVGRTPSEVYGFVVGSWTRPPIRSFVEPAATEKQSFFPRIERMRPSSTSQHSEITMAEAIPHATIDALARSIYKEASTYGFQQVDIIRLINELMDLCTDGDGVEGTPVGEDRVATDYITGQVTRLPLSGEHISIRTYDEGKDRNLLERWFPDRYGRYFVLSCATAQSITIDALSSSPNNHLGIITLLDGRPIGAMAYLDHSRQQKRAAPQADWRPRCPGSGSG